MPRPAIGSESCCGEVSISGLARWRFQKELLRSCKWGDWDTGDGVPETIRRAEITQDDRPKPMENT